MALPYVTNWRRTISNETRRKQMSKLLQNFEANPTKENANKVVRHAMKHMMSLTLLNSDQIAVYDRAYKMAGV